MTSLTTDKHVCNLSDAVVTTSDGLRHYAVIVEKLPHFDHLDRFAELRDKVPFYVTMCALVDAYDAAKGYYDFSYPEEKFTEASIEHSFPTCARCSGA